MQIYTSPNMCHTSMQSFVQVQKKSLVYISEVKFFWVIPLDVAIVKSNDFW